MGGTVVYAIQPQFHLGAYIGFSYDGGTKSTTSTTYMLFAPYGKYFFMEPIRYFRPFILGQFLVQTASERYKDSYGIDQTRTTTSTGIAGSVGAEWFPYSSVGVYGGFKVLEYQIDPSRIIVGLGSSFLGIEWFL
jgi:hypothetical protein